jgi:L-fucose isomerase-like protein
MDRPQIGFVTCVHPRYEVPGVAAMREHATAGLRQSGCDVIEAQIPRTPLDAVEIAAVLKQRGSDLAVLFFCTWVAEDVTLALARELRDKPMLLWALPFFDRDVPMPSPLSGLTGSASNIRRYGKRFVHVIGSVTPRIIEQVARAARVAALIGMLRQARFGLVGDACPGMLDVAVDERHLERMLGVKVVHLELEALLQRAESASIADAARVAERLVAETGGRREVGEEALAENLRLYLAIEQLVSQNRLDAYCVRCWPELRDCRRVTPCVAHALMARQGIPSTCEIDLTALITTYVLAKLAASSAFNFDITGWLEEEGAIQFAHCGAADPSLAEDAKRASLRVHMRTGTGATLEFPFREGRVTLAKALRPVDGGMQMFVAGGRVIPSGEGVRGSVATVVPEPSAGAFLDAMMRLAVEHHVALVYGDWKRELELFCEFTGLEYVPVPA